MLQVGVLFGVGRALLRQPSLYRWDRQTRSHWCRWSSTLDGHKCNRRLLALNPSRFASARQEVLDISNEHMVTLYDKDQEPIRISYALKKPFPPNTVGLFYLKKHLQGRAVRFRLCSGVENFDHGDDLRLPGGGVWSIQAITMMQRQAARYRALNRLSQLDYPVYDTRPRFLNPEKILSLSPHRIINSGQTVLDLSNKHDVFPFLETGFARLLYRGMQTDSQFVRERFPADTKGVLYYKQSATAPMAIGELRLRLCDDVSSFHSSQDLCLPSGLPWAISSNAILTVATYQPLREQLLSEGLLSHNAHSFVSNECGLPVLRSLNQPFPLTVGQSVLSFICKDHSNTTRLRVALRNTFPRGQQSSTGINVNPQGRVVAQLEKYPLQYAEETPATLRLMFAVRVLELLTPVDFTFSTTFPYAEAGQYVERKNRHGIFKPWGYRPRDPDIRAALSEWVKQPLPADWQAMQLEGPS